jgi:hypothetical protein
MPFSNPRINNALEQFLISQEAKAPLCKEYLSLLKDFWIQKYSEVVPKMPIGKSERREGPNTSHVLNASNLKKKVDSFTEQFLGYS